MPLPTGAYAMPLPAAAGAVIDVAGQLERLAALHKTGALNDDEFAAAKAAVLAALKPAQPHQS